MGMTSLHRMGMPPIPHMGMPPLPYMKTSPLPHMKTSPLPAWPPSKHLSCPMLACLQSTPIASPPLYHVCLHRHPLSGINIYPWLHFNCPYQAIVIAPSSANMGTHLTPISFPVLAFPKHHGCYDMLFPPDTLHDVCPSACCNKRPDKV